MTTSAVPAVQPARVAVARNKRRITPGRIVLYAFLSATALVWLVPVLWALYTSFRPHADTDLHGYLSLPHQFNLDNYRAAWSGGSIETHFLNSMIVAVPAIIIILLLASSVAFVVARLSYWFNVPLLVFFMSANLLPPQVLLTPLYRMYLRIDFLPGFLTQGTHLLYDSYLGLILINVAFQTGFCTFVLSNYMKTIPSSLDEAARVDGAGVVRQFFGIILPLCKPALAALATLEFTFIYNDFLWAIVLMSSGDKRPITSSLNDLTGTYFTDNNLIAAAAMMVVLPTLVVYLLLQRHFINGLTLGAEKG
jgi:multiple sugar transport system permease protein